LGKVTREQALQHPNWNMGNKITIDSATLMNKGLEVIEATWLFNLRPTQIEVVIHPQSIIHSMVQFTDGSIKAQLGVPDMRLPIIFALAFPHRIPTSFPRLDFTRSFSLTFHPPDKKLFRNLSLAFQALENGGNSPCILNAANEAAVKAFLENRIDFISIPAIVETCLSAVSFIREPDVQDLIETHQQTFTKAQEIISQ